MKSYHQQLLPRLPLPPPFPNNTTTAGRTTVCIFIGPYPQLINDIAERIMMKSYSSVVPASSGDFYHDRNCYGNIVRFSGSRCLRITTTISKKASSRDGGVEFLDLYQLITPPPSYNDEKHGEFDNAGIERDVGGILSDYYDKAEEREDGEIDCNDKDATGSKRINICVISVFPLPLSPPPSASSATREKEKKEEEKEVKKYAGGVACVVGNAARRVIEEREGLDGEVGIVYVTTDEKEVGALDDDRKKRIKEEGKEKEEDGRAEDHDKKRRRKKKKTGTSVHPDHEKKKGDNKDEFFTPSFYESYGKTYRVSVEKGDGIVRLIRGIQGVGVV